MAKDSKKGKQDIHHHDDGEELMHDPLEPKIRTIFYVFRIFSWETIWVLLGLVGSAITGAMPVLLYLVLGSLINGMTPSSIPPSASPIVNMASEIAQDAYFQRNVNNMARWMAILAGVSFAGGFLNHFFLNYAHDRFGTRLRDAYFRALLNQEIGFFDMKRTGHLVGELADMEVIQDGYTLKTGEVVKNIIQAILGIALAIRAGWKMALVMLSVAPLLAGTLGGAGILNKVFSSRVASKTSAATAVANEVISSMRTVRSMDGEAKEKQRFAKKLFEAHFLYTLKASTLGFTIAFAAFFIWGAIALAFWYGGKLVVEGQQTVGDLFQVFGLVLMAVMGLSMSLQLLPDFGKADAAVKNMLKVVRRKPAFRSAGGLTPNKIVGHIIFKDVCFSYPTRPNVQVLTNFNLEIKPGQSVALVGASGSGKSTIVGLLERFYQPNSGEILLDGVNILDIDPRWLHRNIGIVTQEPTLFAGTIKDNICYAVAGLRTVTDEEIERAAVAANAHDFIMALPNGYKTHLGERGVSLSGGQKQRIAIARAMIQNPSLLILDEATSALDTQSEALVQDALNKLMEGRTSVVIAHRLSTIVDSDLIVVMNKGEVKEKGTHHELLSIPDGHYFKLAQKQMMFGRSEQQSSSDLQDSDQYESDQEHSDSENEELK
jgi:ATP-binding cassette subfamily B (MDR/TAP) protein 1